MFPVAKALEAARIPFLFLTAYALDSIPAEHRSRPFMQKPHHPEGLIEALVDLIEKNRPPPAANDELRTNKSD